MKNSIKQADLLKAIESFVSNTKLSFRVEDESGDYLFYLTSKTGEQFTFEVCSGYVEFYGDKSHDLINYSKPNYVDETITMIKRYLE